MFMLHRSIIVGFISLDTQIKAQPPSPACLHLSALSVSVTPSPSPLVLPLPWLSVGTLKTQSATSRTSSCFCWGMCKNSQKGQRRIWSPAPKQGERTSCWGGSMVVTCRLTWLLTMLTATKHIHLFLSFTWNNSHDICGIKTRILTTYYYTVSPIFTL